MGEPVTPLPAANGTTVPPAPSRTGRRIGLVVRLVVMVGLFVWLATRIEWPLLRDTLAAIDLRLAAAGLLVMWAGLWIAVLRWRLILVSMRSQLTLGETARVFGSGLFLSLFLPTGVGGDFYRLARAAGGGFGVPRAAVSLLLERGVGFLALLMLIAPIVALHERTRDLLPLALLLGGGAVAMLIGFFLWGAPISRWIAARAPALAPALGGDAWDTMARSAPKVFAISLLNHLSTIGANWLFALALGLPLSAWDAMALVPLIVLAGQIPISPGGLGVREAAFVYFYGRIGILSESALAAGLVWLAALYLTGAIGGVLFLLDRRSAPASAASISEASASPEGASGAALDTPSNRH
jgi:uncharacterized membrane protein YbhN (UPF0104 family)